MPSPMMLTGIEQVRSKWGWFVALGLAMILIGMVAMGANYATTMITVIVLGWMLVFTGVFEAISAFYTRSWGGFFLHLLGAALDLALGYLFLVETAQGAVVLTLFLACFLFVGGVFRIIAAISTQLPGWIWVLISGIINVVLGVLLIKQWPYDGLWFIGFCVALELIFRGWFWLMLGFALKQAPTAGSPTK